VEKERVSWTHGRQLCILDIFLRMSLTLHSALNLLQLNSALLKGEKTPINSTHSFLFLFKISLSVNYFLLLQQLLQTVMLAFWSIFIFAFFLVICSETCNAISVVTLILSFDFL